MKKVIIEATKTSKIIEVPMPKAVEDWVLIKIHAAAMCTEYKFYIDGGMPDYPLGHEAAGEVVEVVRPGQVSMGDRVVVMPQYPCSQCTLCLDGDYILCENTYDVEKFTGSLGGDSTYAQYILKPSWLLPKIPDDMSYDHAAMLCCGLGPTFGAMERMKVDAVHTVLITGMGPVGLGGVINGVYRNARVIATAHNVYRAELAKALGADVVINPRDENALAQILALTNSIGVDKSIECSGMPDAQRLCIDATRRNGAVALVGESGDLTIKVSDDIIRNGLQLHGIWHYNLKDIPKLFNIVQDCPEQIDQLITHTFPMSQVQDAWELQSTRQCGKVVLHPWAD